ncbi:ead/Ea22-like family protein [Salmonella enterica]
MSNIDKQALRERYSPKPAPECHICGKEMTIQRMSASRITYGCTGATYDDKGCHYAEGRSIADYHYEQSRVTVVDVSDPDVLALLDELEKDNCSNVHYADAAEMEIAALRQRIAELEARAVTLPADRDAESEVSGYDGTEFYRAGWNARGKADREALTAAGIGVKGE